MVDSLSGWLRYQRRLGWRGLPGAGCRAQSRTGSQPRKNSHPGGDPGTRWEECRRCKLYPGRTHLVFGEGSPDARLMFIGEAPGAEEDLQGRPFVGAAGQLLNNLLHKLGLRREEVYITNVVKSRPPGNRDPEAG